MLSKTTSLLPDALFATLGMPRAGESIKEAKHVKSIYQTIVIYLTVIITRVSTTNFAAHAKRSSLTVPTLSATLCGHGLTEYTPTTASTTRERAGVPARAQMRMPKVRHSPSSHRSGASSQQQKTWTGSSGRRVKGNCKPTLRACACIWKITAPLGCSWTTCKIASWTNMRHSGTWSPTCMRVR